MKIPRFTGLAVALTILALVPAVQSKPTPTPSPTPSPTPAPSPTPSPTPNPADEARSAALLKWLLRQNGGADAASIGWPDLVWAAAGKRITPIGPASSPDAAIVTKIGTALDGLLPLLNKANGAWRSAVPPVPPAELLAYVADELRTALIAVPGSATENLAEPAQVEPTVPTLRWVDAANGPAFYFAVALYPTGGRESTLKALALRPAELAKRVTADGHCVLVAIEHNGKTGRELAFLNWELIDLAKVSLRCAVTFEADQNAVHAAGATVVDGRKGRD